ncbi:MAG: response regulator [Clostridiaceae bacterium]
MYKLMLVEDEDIIRFGLRDEIPWEEIGFVVVGEAADGKSACRMIPELWPDAILTDIRMPGQDGIGFIQKLREMGSEAEIIVLSGYDDFDYARKCIVYGIAEYLLKPVQNRVLYSTFQRLKFKLDSRYNKNFEFDNFKKKTALTFPIAKEKIIQDLLENRLNKENSKGIHTILDMPPDITVSFGVAVFHIGRQMESEALTLDGNIDCFRSVLEEETARFSQYQLLNVLLQKEANNITAVWILHRIQDEDKVGALCSAVKEKFERLPFYSGQIVVSAGVGTFIDDIYSLSLSYSQARVALTQKFYSDIGKIICYTEIRNEYDRAKGKLLINAVDDGRLAGRIADSVIAGDAISCEKAIIGYCDTYLGIYRYNPDILFMHVIELVLKLASAVENQGVAFQPICGDNIEQKIRFLIEERTIHDLQRWLFALVNHLIRHLGRTNSTNSIDHMIEVVKQFIHKNYSNKITSKELCDMAMTSPSYFSGMFKKKTGYALLEYVIMVRIQKAKELLAKSDYRVYEVATIVGYDDFRHFSKQFKKLVQMSPSQFKRNNEKMLMKSISEMTGGGAVHEKNRNIHTVIPESDSNPAGLHIYLN